jgi:hypothetical protein
VGGVEDSPEELVAFFNARLSRPLPDKLIQELFALERECRNRQTDLLNQLERHKISPEESLKEFNAAIGRLMNESRKVLGEKDFALAYGEAGGHPDSLVDPEIFLRGFAE